MTRDFEGFIHARDNISVCAMAADNVFLNGSALQNKNHACMQVA